MDRRERNGDIPSALAVFGEHLQAGLWTALPGIIQSFDPVKKTAVIQPAIKALITKQDGSTVWTALPLLLDCPVFFPSGGGATFTFPIALGDECLVVFASRCIDAWWQLGGIQVQAELRMHDLSDGFAYVGISSVPNVPANINTTAAELRNLAGDTFIRLNPTTKQIDITTPGVLNINAATLNITTTGAAAMNFGTTLAVTAVSTIVYKGSLVTMQDTAGLNKFAVGATNGAFTGLAMTINAKDFATHKHSGVTAGAANTGNVV